VKLDEYVRALAAALAALPPERVALPEGSGVSLVPRQPGIVSLAAKADGQVIGFDRWLKQQPADRRDVRAWSVDVLHAPSFAFAPPDFVALIDAQTPRVAVWARLHELVRESRELNDEPVLEPGTVRQALLDADGGWWGLMADQLMQEAQIECLVEGSEFAVPPALETLFERMEPLFPEDAERFSVYLYPTGSVTVADLVALVEAQGRSERLGPALTAEAAEGFSEFAGQDVSGGMAWLKTRTTHDTEETALGAFVCRAICRFCEEARENPVIPPQLAELFGPDERDQKRAQFRSRVSDAAWRAVSNPDPWTCYVWEDTGSPVPQHSMSPVPFRKALTAIEAFARKNESPYTEAFRLAQFCLDLEPGPWDEAFIKALPRRVEQSGFSELAVEVFGNNLGPTATLARLGWPRDRLGTVLAAGIADVFGGMGSWNDQYFDDAEEYGAVSGALAASFGPLWDALLEPWGGRA
jgi:hypothetical protein